MATWGDVKQYLFDKYKIKSESPDGRVLTLLFETNGGRSQHVFVSLTGNDQIGQWARVESVIGQRDDVDIDRVLEASSDYVCGGVGIIDDFVTLRDSFPLADLQTSELEDPLRLVLTSADQLEQALVGVDRA